MKIQFNDERMKNIKNTLKKYVLVGGLSTMLITASLTGTTINASANNSSDIVYSLNDDKDYLYIENNDNLGDIKNIPTLRELYICNTNIDNPSVFSQCNLTEITLDNCSLKNIKGTDLPQSLTKLKIKNTKITDYSFLSSLAYLDELTIENCEFDDLSCLAKVKKLENLKFFNCNIGRCRGLECLTNLKTLSFENVGIENINELKNLNKLQDLSLIYTYVEDLSPIKNSNIEHLDISNSSNINDISLKDTIKSLPNFKTLITYNNEMSVTPELYDYLNDNNIENYLTTDNLDEKNEVISIANRITNPQMTDNEKIQSIVNYVLDNLEYDYACKDNAELINEYNASALKYALQGIGCCQNYAVLTNALLKEAGIKSYENTGKAFDDNHIWNIVEVEGDYYYIDSTWMDEEPIRDFSDSANYMVDKEIFSDGHEIYTMPSSMYNKIHNVNIEEKTTTNTQSNNETINKEEVTNKVKLSKPALGATVGIALALGGAILIKKKKTSLKEEMIQKK